MYMSARVIREHWELLKLGRNFSFIPFVEINQLRPFATRMWLPVQRLWNLWLPVSALEQNYRLGLGTRLRLPLLVNTIARETLISQIFSGAEAIDKNLPAFCLNVFLTSSIRSSTLYVIALLFTPTFSCFEQLIFYVSLNLAVNLATQLF